MRWLIGIIVVVLVILAVYLASRRSAPSNQSGPTSVTIPINHYTINLDGSVTFSGVPSLPTPPDQLLGRFVALSVGQYGSKSTTIAGMTPGANLATGEITLRTAPGTYPGPFISNVGQPGNVAVIT
jgi:hypothetical protein